jgi:hypothetical protein
MDVAVAPEQVIAVRAGARFGKAVWFFLMGAAIWR